MITKVRKSRTPTNRFKGARIGSRVARGNLTPGLPQIPA